MRLGAIFVAVCMTVIAVSAGAVVYYAYGFTGADAIMVAIAALTSLGFYNTVSTRMNVKSVVGPQLAELSRGSADLARQLAEVGRRLAAVEGRIERSLTKGEAAIEPLAVEISELGALMDQLAGTVAIHETQLKEIEVANIERDEQERSRAAAAKLERVARVAAEAAKPEPAKVAVPAAPPASQPPAVTVADVPAVVPAVAAAPMPEPAQTMAAPAPSAAIVPMPVAVAAAPGTPDLIAVAPVTPAVTGEDRAAKDMLLAIRSAVEANRIDLYLQPIVTLPQRKVRYYEAMSRLRTEQGDVLPAADFVAPAEAAGLMPKIDNLVVFRCVQVVRRLLLKNREIGAVLQPLGIDADRRRGVPAIAGIPRSQPRHRAFGRARIHPELRAQRRPDREREPGGARRARLSLLARQS